MAKKENRLAFLTRVQQLLDPLIIRLESIESKITRGNREINPLYYRNEDLKKIFGLSNNTIIKYRQTGILPYTKLGDIFLYDRGKIDKILKSNGS
ncbi:hypothetical protein D3C87_791220 [compost metagenome]